MNKYILTLLILFISLISFAQTDKEIASSLITKNKIEAHIYFLASDEMRGRETGTNEGKIAAQYLANQLHAYGAKQVPNADGFFQNVPLSKTIAATKRSIHINGEEHAPPAPIEGGNFSYDGAAVYVNYGLEKDYEGQDVKGKLVYVKAGSETIDSAREMFGLIEQKKALAKKHGAVAIVELANINPAIWSFIDHAYSENRIGLVEKDEEKEDFNYFWVLDTNNDIANSIASNKKNVVEITISGIKKEKIISRNVIAMVEGTDPKLKNEYIIYSGHYDHVGIGKPDATGDSIYNGARDNAVGVTTVLSMAENLAKYPTKRSALFILFTGEEKGLLGSKYYVENPLIALNQMVYCFNSDNAGYNDTSIITVVGLGRTTAENDIKVAASAFGLQAKDDPAPEQNLFDRSDNVHFAAKGIPAPTYSLGFTSFSGNVTDHYHQPSDEADSIDFDYLVKFFKAYVLSGRLIGNNPKTPFWVSGDTYEAAGKELYNKK